MSERQKTLNIHERKGESIMKKTTLILTLTALLCVSTSCSKDELSDIQNTSAVANTTTSTTAATDVTSITTTTAKATESTTAEVSTAVNTDSTGDYADLSGYWYINGDPNGDFFHVTKEGKVKTYHMDGVIAFEGEIKRELDTDSNNYVYNIYDEYANLYLSFADDGEKEKNDIYTVESDAKHYVKLYGEDDGKAAEESFIGSWRAGRAIIEISDNGDGTFHALIKWGGSADSSGQWDYTLTYDNGKLVCNGNGILKHIEYNVENSELTETVEYSDGSAEFSIEGNRLHWIDFKEHNADRMLFINERNIGISN
jgi:uncharacterized protein YcfL